MRRVTIPLLLFMVFGLSGCLISTQVGERTHVDLPPPDEMTFHFNTPFNKILLFGRSAALLLICLWALSARVKGGDNTLALIIAAAALVGSGWWLIVGWSTVFDYRVVVHDELLHLDIPSEPDRIIPWQDIETVRGGGIARNASFGDAINQEIKWASEWEDLTITLKDGRKLEVGLRRLSVEQRGTLWRAIARKTRTGVKQRFKPDED
jgi:hypothetical protein